MTWEIVRSRQVRSNYPTITLRGKAKEFTLSKRAVEYCKANEYPFAFLYVDSERHLIGIVFSKTDGSYSLALRHEGTNVRLSATAFIEDYGITIGEESHRTRITLDESNRMFIAEIAEFYWPKKDAPTPDAVDPNVPVVVKAKPVSSPPETYKEPLPVSSVAARTQYPIIKFEDIKEEAVRSIVRSAFDIPICNRRGHFCITRIWNTFSKCYKLHIRGYATILPPEQCVINAYRENLVWVLRHNTDLEPGNYDFPNSAKRAGRPRKNETERTGY